MMGICILESCKNMNLVKMFFVALALLFVMKFCMKPLHMNEC